MGFILDSSDYPGHLKDYGGSLIANHLLCDGSSYLVASYPNLFASIGYTFGGSGANFNVPDSRRRTHIGSGGSQVSGPGTSVGNTGGEETHALSVAEMPNHSHSTGLTVTTGSNVTTAWGSLTRNDTSLTTGSQGGNGSHNNMQPSIVVTKMIRY